MEFTIEKLEETYSLFKSEFVDSRSENQFYSLLWHVLIDSRHKVGISRLKFNLIAEDSSYQLGVTTAKSQSVNLTYAYFKNNTFDSVNVIVNKLNTHLYDRLN